MEALINTLAQFIHTNNLAGDRDYTIVSVINNSMSSTINRKITKSLVISTGSFEICGNIEFITAGLRKCTLHQLYEIFNVYCIQIELYEYAVSSKYINKMKHGAKAVERAFTAAGYPPTLSASDAKIQDDLIAMTQSRDYYKSELEKISKIVGSLHK